MVREKERMLYVGTWFVASITVLAGEQCNQNASAVAAMHMNESDTMHGSCAHRRVQLAE
jgi:hypothetical protein